MLQVLGVLYYRNELWGKQLPDASSVSQQTWRVRRKISCRHAEQTQKCQCSQGLLVLKTKNNQPCVPQYVHPDLEMKVMTTSIIQMWKDWQGIEQREGSATVHQERDALLFVLLPLGEQGEEPRSVPSESITH